MSSGGQLEVGYAQVDITPNLGVPLSGMMARNGRFCGRIRDPLFARAIHFSTPEGGATLVVADLLVITAALHEAVARKAGGTLDDILLAATHTHSGPGAYWDAGRARLFMGEYDRAVFERLSDDLAGVVRDARSSSRRATLAGASKGLVGASSNRRQLHGPIDPELSLLRFEPEGEQPIDLVSYGAHPVIGAEREPEACTSDFPGEICSRIEKKGRRAVFLTGAVGGLSPLFPEFPMRYDEHLELYSGLLERGYDQAVAELEPIDVGRVEVARVDVPVGTVSCEMFPHAGLKWSIAERAAYPLRWWVQKMGTDARTDAVAPVHYLRLGETALVGTPADLGVRVALAMKEALRAAGVRVPIIGSQCDGYVGYVHLPEDYERVPEPGFREMAFYENAMSLSGRGLGRRWVSALDAHVSGPS